MNYTLYIANRTYSSWSLRGWLLFKSFHIPVETKFAFMRTESFPEMLAQAKPATLVPAMRVHQGDHSYMVWDSLAMMETLAENMPNAGLLPKDPEMRAIARSLCAEMHSGFQAMRREMPMNLQRRSVGYGLTKAVQAEINRFEYLLAWTKQAYAKQGAWFLGDKFSAVDVFYLPLVSRLHSYGVPVSSLTQTYLDHALAHPDFVSWTYAAMQETMLNPNGEMRYIVNKAFVPKQVTAYHGSKQQAVNFACPTSAMPISETALACADGAVLGFCNISCRDAFVAKPEKHEIALRLLSGSINMAHPL